MTKPDHDAKVAPKADPEQLWQEAAAAGLIGHTKTPLNYELPPCMLGGEITPTRQFFRRNHFPLPELDPVTWRLQVAGLVRRPLSLSLADIRAWPTESVTVTLECAGNGRALFSPAVPGERWGLGAVSTARWTGARLRDVLDRAELRPAARAAIFRGADGGQLPDLPEPISFERSLSLPDIAESGALLAYEMNGEPLPVQHGFPVRLIVPGWYAVASVKWLAEIALTDEPFSGFFQDTHYVYEWARDGRIPASGRREPVRQQRVRAMIVDPAAGQRISGPNFVVRGVAWSGEAPVTHVEICVLTGAAPASQSWQHARLLGGGSRYGWRRWELAVSGLPAGPARVRARAADAAGNDQLTTPEWNELGYGGNFVHEVAVTVG